MGKVREESENKKKGRKKKNMKRSERGKETGCEMLLNNNNNLSSTLINKQKISRKPYLRKQVELILEKEESE